MTQIVLSVKENKLDFFIELVRNFDFVNVLKKEEKMSEWKKETLSNIRTGFEEMKLVEKGKMKSRPAKRLLDEL